MLFMCVKNKKARLVQAVAVGETAAVILIAVALWATFVLRLAAQVTIA